jgi:spermidine synthase
VGRSDRLKLGCLVFAAGAASLATEVTGARLLAPYFGSSDVVWANVIGLILLFLSLGYWAGGRLADRHPHARALGLVALVAAAGIAALPFATRPALSAAANAFDSVSAGAFIGSFFSAMAMFAIPVTALGAVSPWAIRLAVRDVREAGAVAGRLYALSTLGSILGTFLPVLVLVPAIGSRRTLLACAAVLALAAAPLVGRRYLLAPALVAGLALVPTGLVKPGQGVLFEGESPYQFVQVVRDGDSVVLHLNEGWAVHSIYEPGAVLTHNYWDAFLTLPLLTERPAGRLSILGNAAGTISTAYGKVWPQTRIDGVELDPLVTQVGRRYFHLASNRRLTVHTQDARVFLERTRAHEDEIVVDAYRQPYIPFYLTTREFFSLAAERLTPGGVVAINVGTPPGETAIVSRIAATMRAVFPAVLSSRYDEFNSIVIGFTDPLAAARAARTLAAARGIPAAPAHHLAATLRPVAPDPGAVLTDDNAPVEQLTDRALLDYLREGAPGATGG